MFAEYKLANEFPFIGNSYSEATEVARTIANYKRVTATPDYIRKMKEFYPNLSHVRTENTTVYVWVEPRDNNKVVGFVSVETKPNGEKWIQAIEVAPGYRGHTLGKQILSVATGELGAEYLSVQIDNKVAIKMYKRAGFDIYRSTADQYFMKLDK